MSASRNFATSLARLKTAASRPSQFVHGQNGFMPWSPTPSTQYRTSIISRCRALPTASRTFTSTAQRHHNHIDPPKPGEELRITFVDKEGGRHTFEVAAGDNLLDIAQSNELEMEGACGGSCACSTCHVVVEDEAHYDLMPEPEDDENDMLDLAFGLTETSRLGCQVTMTKELDGMVVKLPSMTRNMQASDFS